MKANFCVARAEAGEEQLGVILQVRRDAGRAEPVIVDPCPDAGGACAALDHAVGVLGDAGPLPRGGKSILRLPGVKVFFRGRRTRRGRGPFTSSAQFSKWTPF